MKLSIIIPAYNAEKFISTCIESIYEQGLPLNDFEVITVLDGCTDNTTAIIESLQKEHNNIKIIEQENQGVSVARNNGVSASKGLYILFVDADDAIYPGTLGKMLDFAENKQLDILEGDLTFIENSDWENVYNHHMPGNNIDNSSINISNGTEYFINHFDKERGYCFLYLIKRNLFSDNSILFNKNILFCEDLWVSLQLVLRSQRIAHYPIRFYAYRKYAQSVSASMNIPKFKSILWVSQQIRKNRHEYHAECRHKLNEISSYLYILCIWYLANYSSMYDLRKEIIPCMHKPIYTTSLSSFITSLIFRLCPYTFIKIKKKLSKHTY